MSGSGDGSSLDLATIVALVLSQTDFSVMELMEMSEDSGLDIQQFLIDLITYLYEPVDSGDGKKTDLMSSPRWETLSTQIATPCDTYEQQLRDWLMKCPNLRMNDK